MTDESAIRVAASRFLHDPPPDALRGMPPEFRGNVPRDAGGWTVTEQAEGRAKLVAYPPGGVTATDRFFYELHLQRDAQGVWQVSPAVVSFVHAWAQR